MPRSLCCAVCSRRIIATRSDPGREHLHTAAPHQVLTSGSHVVHADCGAYSSQHLSGQAQLCAHTIHEYKNSIFLQKRPGRSLRKRWLGGLGKEQTLLFTNSFAPSSQRSLPLWPLSRGLNICISASTVTQRRACSESASRFCALCVDLGVDRGKKEGPTGQPSFSAARCGSTVMLLLLVLTMIWRWKWLHFSVRMRKLSSHCHLFVKRWHFTFSWLTLINAISTFKVNQTQVEFGFSDCYHLTKKFSAIESIIGKFSEIESTIRKLSVMKFIIWQKILW